MNLDVIIKLTACTFIQELMLRDIDFTMESLCGGYRWTFPGLDGDVAIDGGTLGNENGYLESRRMPWENDGEMSILKPDIMAQLIAERI